MIRQAPLAESADGLRNFLLRGSIWAFGGAITVSATALVASAMAARLLSPQEFGAYVLAASFVTFGAILPRMGLNIVVVRLVAELRAEKRDGAAHGVINRMLILVTLSSLSASLIVLSGLGTWVSTRVFESPELATVVPLISLWLFIDGVRLVVSETFRGLGNIRRATLFGDAARGAATVCIFGVVALTAQSVNLTTLVAAAVIASALTFAPALTALLSTLRGLGQPVRVSTRSILRVSVPVMITGLTVAAVNQGDIWVVAANMNHRSLALYAASVRLAAILIFPSVVANAVVSPLVPRLYRQAASARLENILRLAATVAAVPALAAFLLLVFWSSEFAALVFGDFFGDAGQVLVILALGQFFNVSTGLCGMALIMTGNERIVMHVTILAAVFAICGEVFAANFLGLSAVAAFSAGGTIIQNAVLIAVAKSRLGIWTTPFLSPVKIFHLIQKG